MDSIQQGLEGTDARSRLLFEDNPQPMWVYDATTLRFLDVNQAAIDRYGYSRDEFLSMRIVDIRPVEEIERLMPTLANLTDHEWEWHREWRHRVKSGEVIDVDILTHALTFEGTAARLVIITDITERMRTERALREMQDRMRVALTSSGVGIWESDFTTGEIYWSETQEAMHGLAPGTFGRTLDAVLACVHADDHDQVRAAFGGGGSKPRDAEFEYRTIWRDGTEHWIRVRPHYAYDANGEMVRAAGIALDVTSRRLLEDQFRQAQKMEAVGQLAGGIAHDFNNMLTAIIGNAEFVLEDTPPDDQRRADVEEITRAARRAATLTHQLLAFSRKQMLMPRVLHLGDIISEVTPMLRRLLGETIDLKAIVADRGHVKADAGQMEQVLVNLAVNARDAMPSGGRLTIETMDVMLDERYARDHPTVRPGPHVMLAVSDTGVGMARATLKHVFEPFFTTKPKGKGTGLGLATVYGIVKQSGGHIWVYSEPGRGTSFKVYLPRTDEAEETRPSPAPHADTLRGHETILLVEDEEVVREFVYKVLTRSGYTVHAMADPQRAIHFADAHTGVLHAIVSDVVLPGISGPAMVSRLLAKHPASKVLYMSGYTDNAVVHHGVLDADTWFLQKPFTSEALVKRVRELLDRPTSGTA
jgi:PAS domain S-box-containing protein